MSGPTRDDNRARRAVADYVRHHRWHAVAEIDFYRTRGSLREAIDQAARAVGSDGRKHPHQRRLPVAKLTEFSQLLRQREGDVRKATTFAELHAVVDDVGSAIWTDAELAVYDAALRMGAYRGLLPDVVCLHRGTRSGAAALGLGQGRATLALQELPKPFRRLQAHEAEDCLCIFKEFLAGCGAPPTGTCGCGGRGGC